MAEKVGINCGSGQRPFQSTGEVRWINVDSQARWNPDIVCDATKGLPYPDRSIDYFVLHHVIEHFGCGEAQGLIKEAYRVLKEGGSLVIAVPDMEALARKWLIGTITTQIYMTNVYGAYMGSEDDRHKWGFDIFSLQNFLEPFRWSAMLVRLPEIPGADLARDWWILGLECIK